VDTFLAIASKRDQRAYSARKLSEDLVQRILEAGRLAGSASNRQPWTFFVVESEELRSQLAETVYAPDNISDARLVVAIVVTGSPGFDCGRAAQNMMLAAWNEGVTSCPNGMPEPQKTADLLGLSGEEHVLNILSFGYPARPRDPESRPADDWLAGANRKPLHELVRRL
jgi:nitroreductase